VAEAANPTAPTFSTRASGLSTPAPQRRHLHVLTPRSSDDPPFALRGAYILSLLIGALPAFDAFGSILYSKSAWNPVTKGSSPRPCPIYGTVVNSFIAMLMRLATGYDRNFSDRNVPKGLRRPWYSAIELLAGLRAHLRQSGDYLVRPIPADDDCNAVDQPLFGERPVVVALFEVQLTGSGCLPRA